MALRELKKKEGWGLGKGHQEENYMILGKKEREKVWHEYKITRFGNLGIFGSVSPKTT